MFTLTVRNLRALRHVEWSPSGLCVVVGPNGSGKSTLINAIRFLRFSHDRGIDDAVREVFGGSYALRHWDAVGSDPIEFRVTRGSFEYLIQLPPERGATLDEIARERVIIDGSRWFDRDQHGNIRTAPEEQRPYPFDRLALPMLAERTDAIEAVRAANALIKNMTAFQDLGIYELRTVGSSAGQDKHLHTRGLNAYTMLHKWHVRRDHRHRYDFVLDTLREAFPKIVHDLDFDVAPNKVALRTYRPGDDTPVYAEFQANGFLQLLVLLCAVAQGDSGSLAAIDEPENGLHPFAIRVFLERTAAWCDARRSTAVLTTHSPVVLNHFDATPEQVYTLGADAEGELRRLTDLKNPEWLRRFRLGDLLVDEDLGSNA